MLEEADLEAVIGLEIHVELNTKSKMFCSSAVSFGAQPNTHVCPVCLGMPGSLPVINERAVEYTAIIGLALGCEIAGFTQFHRKNYYYPDMPKNYQISQYDSPICGAGKVQIEMDDYQRLIGITRVHLEEDTGKMTHVGSGGRITGADYSLVDFNRAGTPLAEIVSEPDIRTPEEAKAFVQKLRSILLHLGVSDCNMEEGSLRCDANISLRPVGNTDLGTKAEVKNMNSFRALTKALSYEIGRQVNALDDGERIVQQTRHWDTERGITTPLRSKEEARDYRYFADPDLMPLDLSREWVEARRRDLPELPDERIARFEKEFELPTYDARFMIQSKAHGDYFESLAKVCPDPKQASNWMMGELAAHLNEAGVEIGESPIDPEMLAEMLRLIDDGTISGKMAKTVFSDMFSTGKPAGEIVEEKGLKQITDTSDLEELIDDVLGRNEQAVQEYRDGKKQAFGFLVGQTMAASRGQASPALVNEILRAKLDS